MLKNFAVSFFLTIFLSLHISVSEAEELSDKTLLSSIAKGNAEEYKKSLEYIKLNHPATLPDSLKKKFLESNDEKVKERIITALAEYSFQDLYALWTEILETAKDKKTELQIIDALSLSKTVLFTIPIAEKLKAPRSEVREKAAMVLKKYGDDRMFVIILSLGNSSNPVERIYFLEALNHLYDARFQKIVVSMLDDENKSVRMYALKCINNNDIKESLPALRRLLQKDSNDEIKKLCITSLVLFRDTQSCPAFSAALKNQNRAVRLEAVKAIMEMRYYIAARPLSELLLQEDDTEIKWTALDTLISFKRMGNPNCIRYIIENDEDPGMRIKAVYIAGISRESGSFNLIKSALNDKDYRVRGEACNAIGLSKRDSNASEILLNQIKTDKSLYVKTAALYAIIKINDSRNRAKLFDIYSEEEDKVFKELLRKSANL